MISASAPASEAIPPQQILSAPQPVHNGRYGSAIAIHGEWMIIGGHAENAPNQKGDATLYRRVGGAWVYWNDLRAPVDNLVPAGAGFGWHVAVSDELALVSANRGDGGSQPSSGAVFVYRRSGTTWTYHAQLGAPASSAILPEFGHWCDVSGGTIVVGAPRMSLTSGNQEGRAYVFEYDFATDEVAQTATLDAFTIPGCTTNCWVMGGFGGFVDVEGDSIAIMAPDSIAANSTCCDSSTTGSNPSYGVGSICLFRRDSSGWIEEQRIEPSPSDWTDSLSFGIDVTLRGDLLFAPIPGANGGAGRIDVYARDNATQSWSRLNNLTLSAPNPLPGERLGIRFDADADARRVIAGMNESVTCGSSQARCIVAHRDDNGTSIYTDDSWDCVSAIHAPLLDSWFGVDVAIDSNGTEANEYAVGARCHAEGGAPAGSGSALTYSIPVACPCECAADVGYHGTGCAGTLGIPSIGISGTPIAGGSNSLSIGNSFGQPTVAHLMVGVTDAMIPRLGCHAYLVPLIVMTNLPIGSVSAPTAGLELPIEMPSDPSICGLTILLQAIVADPGGPSGFAFTERLDLTVGS